MWLLLLVSCFEPTESGPGALVGRVLGPLDLPIADLQVQSLEARSVTDKDGAFAVQFKEPDQHVTFTFRGAFYRRVYRPEDAGQKVRVEVPELRDSPVTCRIDAPCKLAMSWDLGDGLSATASYACVPGGGGTIPGVPGRPATTATCGEMTVMDDGAMVVVSAPAKRTEIVVRGADGAAAPDCVVEVEGAVVAAAGSSFAASLVRPSVATAICRGVPALPAIVEPGRTAELVWSPDAPTLDLSAILPDAGAAWLLSDGSPSWLARLPGEGGVFRLPPIGPGTYRIGAARGTSPPEALVLALVDGPIPEAPGPGLVLGEIADGVVGTLRIEGEVRPLYAPGRR